MGGWKIKAKIPFIQGIIIIENLSAILIKTSLVKSID